MPKQIKTRTTTKTIKLLDRAANLGNRAKSILVKSKQSAEETQKSQHNSASDYAIEKTSSQAKSSTHGAVHRAKNKLKHPIKNTKNKITHAKEHFQKVKQQLPKQRKQTAEQAKQAAEKATKTAYNLKSKAQQAQKTAQTSKKAVTNAKSSFQDMKYARREILKYSKNAKNISRGSIKTAKKSIKTSKRTVKSAKITAKTTLKASKTAVQTSKATAKTAAKTAKAATKSTIAAVKATIAAVKGTVSLLIAGGWVAVVIILVICMVGMLLSSSYGIFFSGEKSDSGYSMPAVINQLNTEFYSQIDELQNANPHDELDMGAMAIQWENVLAVYAVRAGENGEVATLDDKKIDKLRGILNDMASLKHSISVVEREENEQITVLKITLEQKTVDEMAAKYRFSNSQKEQVNELLQPEFASLWAQLIGGYSPGSGEIIQSKSEYKSKGIFSWMYENDYPISSPFGYRADPFTGERSFHGALDIAAPSGTPILAMADGIVSVANSIDSWGGGYGFFVRIAHEGGYETLYAHCSKIAVVGGQEVRQGQVIGFVGSTGRSTNPHLHVELSKDGVRINPLNYFE